MNVRKYRFAAHFARVGTAIALLLNLSKKHVNGSRDDNRVPMPGIGQTPTGDKPKQSVAKSEARDQANPEGIIAQDGLCKPELSNGKLSKEDIEWAILVSMPYV